MDTWSLRSALPFAAEPATVLAVGRLEPYKGVADLLRAFSGFPSPVQLVIIGEGSQRAELELLGDTLGLTGRVRFLGFVPTGVMHRRFATGQVLVSLSRPDWPPCRGSGRVCGGTAGVGYPVGRLGISIFAIRLRGHMEVGATFDESVLDPAAVRRAIGSLSEPDLLRRLTT